jgi:DTW domain-containing protein YfiP
MSAASSARRPVCASCWRPQSSCICRWITPVVNVVEVLILQHPLEVDHPKGSARLLQLSLAHSRMLTGERFAAQHLQQLLTAPFQAGAAASGARHNILLYPDTPQDRAPGRPPPLAPGLLLDASKLRLIVLDGTWRKSRKMLVLNPLLQQLPRLALQQMPASNYRIRRAHKSDQLSTLEAICAALAQLEGGAGKFQPLLAAFDGFVAQQLGYQNRSLSAP